jgi:hypothetical protein
MSIREIEDNLYSKGKKPHIVWEINISGKILYMERFGSFCFWNYIRVRKDKTEVYKITLDHKYFKNRDIGERTEFFFNQPLRKYKGDQFSFIEYLSIIAEQERFPEPQEFIKIGLDIKIEKQYRKYLQDILLPKN